MYTRKDWLVPIAKFLPAIDVGTFFFVWCFATHRQLRSSLDNQCQVMDTLLQCFLQQPTTRHVFYRPMRGSIYNTIAQIISISRDLLSHPSCLTSLYSILFIVHGGFLPYSGCLPLLEKEPLYLYSSSINMATIPKHVRVCEKSERIQTSRWKLLHTNNLAFKLHYIRHSDYQS